MSLCELPSEILLKIFSYVEGESVFVLPRVCRRWRVICSTLAVQEIKWKHYPMKIEEFVVMLSKFGRIESLNFNLGKKNSDPVDDLIGQTDVWLGVNPEHASNGGKINGWSDVFSEKQEQIIIREFGGWLKSQGYIKE